MGNKSTNSLEAKVNLLQNCHVAAARIGGGDGWSVWSRKTKGVKWSFGRVTTLLRGLTITMVTNHTGMILQVPIHFPIPLSGVSLVLWESLWEAHENGGSTLAGVFLEVGYQILHP